MYKIVVTDEQGTSQIVPLMDLEQAWVGRDETSDVVLEERNISRKHLRIWKTEGRVFIQDVSRYGTKLNGNVVSGESQIVEGDLIQVGDFQLTLQVETSKSLDIQAIPGFSGGDTKPVGRLVMLGEPLPGHQILLPELGKEFSRLFIGRSNDSEVLVDHRSISRKHVEIVCDKGVYQIRDLGSANGTLVNGREIYQVNLNPGDLIEIGKVRFRYVAPGQPYDHNKDPEANVEESRFRSGRWIFVLLIMVAIAILGIVGWALLNHKEGLSNDAELLKVPEAEDLQNVQVEIPDDSSLLPSLEKCLRMVRQKKAMDALKMYGEYLENPKFAKCKREIASFRQQQEIFNRGKKLYEKQEVEKAISIWLTLPESSSFRDEDLIAQVTESYVRKYLGSVDDMRLNPEMEKKIRKLLLFSPFLSDDTLQTLENKLSQANKEGSSKVSRKKKKRAKKKPTQQSKKAVQTSENKKNTGTQFDFEKLTPFQKARDCLRQGDNSCAIRALKGKTQNARELALLIATYRQVGNSAAATKHMQEFVQKYPNDRRAIRFKKLLAQP